MDPIYGGGIAELYSGASNRPVARFLYRGGARYRTCDRSQPPGDARLAECDLVTWDQPNGQRRLVLALVLPCPECGYSIVVSGKSINDYAVAVDDERSLTMRAHVKCPAWWEVYTAEGYPTGQRAVCGWQGVVRDGHAHNPRCACANFTDCPEPTVANCTCGALITADEAAFARR